MGPGANLLSMGYLCLANSDYKPKSDVVHIWIWLPRQHFVLSIAALLNYGHYFLTKILNQWHSSGLGIMNFHNSSKNASFNFRDVRFERPECTFKYDLCTEPIHRAGKKRNPLRVTSETATICY